MPPLSNCFISSIVISKTDPPELFYMTINGSIVSDGDNLLIEASTQLEVQCHVLISGQASNLSWVVGNERKYSHVTHVMYRDSYGQTFFNSSSTLRVHVESVNETLACVRRTFSDEASMKDVKVHFTTFGKQNFAR